MAPEHFLQLAEAIEFSGFSAATRTVLQIAYEFLSMVALGELHKGVKKSPRSSQNRQRVDDFLQIARCFIYPNVATAEIYATAAVELEVKGQAIPENDIWIDAVALQCDIPLATRDAHFQRVEGLTVIEW
jgi:tRNA(fMet)-specific endonuclease VapC